MSSTFCSTRAARSFIASRKRADAAVTATPADEIARVLRRAGNAVGPEVDAGSDTELRACGEMTIGILVGRSGPGDPKSRGVSCGVRRS